MASHFLLCFSVFDEILLSVPLFYDLRYNRCADGSGVSVRERMVLERWTFTAKLRL